MGKGKKEQLLEFPLLEKYIRPLLSPLPPLPKKSLEVIYPLTTRKKTPFSGMDLVYISSDKRGWMGG
jgi:hypothetical protein